MKKILFAGLLTLSGDGHMTEKLEITDDLRVVPWYRDEAIGRLSGN